MVAMEFLVAGSVTSTVRVGASTITGVGRDANQDSMLAGPTWFIVADGVGGHGAGDVASGMAVELLGSQPRPDDLDELRQVITGVNSAIHGSARRDAVNRMATTVVGAVVIGEDVHVFHLGDSRCYRFHDGRLELLTRDHSYVQELVDAGVLSTDQARSHRRRNVITRALGVDELAEPEISTIETTDRLMLCSDGVSSMLTADQMTGVLSGSPDPQAAADALVEAAIAAGSRDDVTALVVDGLAVR